MLPLLILTATISYGLYNVFTARSGGEIDAVFAAALRNSIAAILPLAYFLLIVNRRSNEIIKATQRGYLYSVLGGISIAIFSVVFLLIFEKGGNVSFVVPLVYGGSTVLAALIAIFLFKEPVNGFSLFGIISIVVGLLALSYSKL
jgi:uncharacterized membrane protein